VTAPGCSGPSSPCRRTSPRCSCRAAPRTGRRRPGRPRRSAACSSWGEAAATSLVRQNACHRPCSPHPVLIDPLVASRAAWLPLCSGGRRRANRHLLRAGSRAISWLLGSTEDTKASTIHGHAPLFRQILLIECVCSVRVLDRSSLNNRIVNMLHLLATHSCLRATRGIELKTVISGNSLQILCCKWIQIPLPAPSRNRCKWSVPEAVKNLSECMILVVLLSSAHIFYFPMETPILENCVLELSFQCDWYLCFFSRVCFQKGEEALNREERS
jgi:hypothetical protein